MTALVSRLNQAFLRALPPKTATVVIDHSLRDEWKAAYPSWKDGAKFFLGRPVVFEDCSTGVKFSVVELENNNSSQFVELLSDRFAQARRVSK